MLILKLVAALAGLGILVVAAGLVLYDVALAVNFQRPVARGTALGAQASGPAFCRPAVFLYQRNLAERKARLAAGRVQRLRQSVRARRRAAMS